MNFPFPEEQLKFVVDVASWRNDPLNVLFGILRLFDTPYFSLLLIPLVWFGFSYRWGLRIFCLVVVNMFVNSWAKLLFGWPRPGDALPELPLYAFPGYGFPSGGAQSAILLGGLLIYLWRTKVAWIMGIVSILLLSFTRIYLGAHYPLDVLGGWVFGGTVLALFIFGTLPVERYLLKKGFGFSASVALGLALFLLFVAGIKGQTVAILLMTCGACLSLRYHLFLPPTTTVREGIKRVVFVLGGALVFFIAIPKEWWAYNVAMPLWVSLVASPVFQRLFR